MSFHQRVDAWVEPARPEVPVSSQCKRDASAPYREMTIEHFRTVARLVRKRLPHRAAVVPALLMLDIHPWTDAVSFGELSRRLQLPTPSSHVEIAEALRNQAELDGFGPPDEHDNNKSRTLKVKAIRIIFDSRSIPPASVHPDDDNLTTLLRDMSSL